MLQASIRLRTPPKSISHLQSIDALPPNQRSVRCNLGRLFCLIRDAWAWMLYQDVICSSRCLNDKVACLNDVLHRCGLCHCSIYVHKGGAMLYIWTQDYFYKLICLNRSGKLSRWGNYLHLARIFLGVVFTEDSEYMWIPLYFLQSCSLIFPNCVY
jgi:hypothetical protein